MAAKILLVACCIQESKDGGLPREDIGRFGSSRRHLSKPVRGSKCWRRGPSQHQMVEMDDIKYGRPALPSISHRNSSCNGPAGFACAQPTISDRRQPFICGWGDL